MFLIIYSAFVQLGYLLFGTQVINMKSLICSLYVINNYRSETSEPSSTPCSPSSEWSWATSTSETSKRPTASWVERNNHFASNFPLIRPHFLPVLHLLRLLRAAEHVLGHRQRHLRRSQGRAEEEDAGLPNGRLLQDGREQRQELDGNPR